MYTWHPIQPLSTEEMNLDLAAMKPLYESWRAYKARLGQQNAENLATFNRQLIRRLSIETGILEKLYDLDRGTTEALVAHGFVEDLVSRSDGNIDPARIIDYLRDQESAIQLVVDCVANNRPLTRGVIHELHAILTAHQDTTEGKDALGRRVDVPLLKGQYKVHPNNPRRADGTMHEYCPPIHVEAEMDNLLRWFSEYEREDPIIVSAWLHHRFAQIHPYQDGNGRLSRVLVTYVLLKANLLPLVIDRDLRLEYIRDLEIADEGDLSKLSRVFARLERTAILQALSLERNAPSDSEYKLSSAVINSISDRLQKREQQKSTELRSVNVLALKLRVEAKKYLDASLEQLRNSLHVRDLKQFTQEGGTDKGNGHYYKFEIATTAKKTGRFANFTEDHYFTRTVVQLGSDRLVFVVSLHHAGRELSGIMEATSFARLESTDKNSGEAANADSFVICSMDPFVLTYRTQLEEISEGFASWLDTALAVALKEFGDTL